MKESWLFDKLDTLGEDEKDIDRREGLEEDARALEKIAFGAKAAANTTAASAAAVSDNNNNNNNNNNATTGNISGTSSGPADEGPGGEGGEEQSME